MAAVLMAGNNAAFSAVLSTSDGLEFTLTSTGVLDDTKYNGTDISGCYTGGFYFLDASGALPDYTQFTGQIQAITGGWQFTATAGATTREPDNLSIRADYKEMGDYIEVAGELEDITSPTVDRAIWLQFKIPLDAMGWRWWDSINYTRSVPGGGTGGATENNLYPLPTASGPLTGVAMAIPPTKPIVFKCGCDNDGLRLTFAVGLCSDTSKFPSKAAFSFRIYRVSKDWGFRDALEKYYNWFSDYYDNPDWIIKKLYHIGIWHHGGNYKPERDFENRPAHMAYFNLKGAAKDIDGTSIVDEATLIEQIEKCTNFHWHDDPNKGRAVFYSSRLFKPNGGTFIITPGATSVAFPLNMDMDLFSNQSPVPDTHGAHMYDKVTGVLGQANPNFDSIHFDTVGSWARHTSYRRQHFPYVDYTLTFDENGRVVHYNYWGQIEFLKKLRGWVLLEGDCYIEGAGMKIYGWGDNGKVADIGEIDGRWFIAPMLDSSWHEGSFKVNAIGLYSQNGYDYERTVMGRKSYRIASGNIIKRGELPTVEKVKRALSQNTVYGFPSPIKFEYFITDPDHPLYNPDYSKYTRDKELWDKYIPTAEAMRLARWQPVTHATHNKTQSQIIVERFGSLPPYYFSVWTPENGGVSSVDVTIDLAALGISTSTFSVTEEISNVTLTTEVSGKNLIVTVPMKALWTRVLKVTEPDLAVFLHPG